MLFIASFPCLRAHFSCSLNEGLSKTKTIIIRAVRPFGDRALVTLPIHLSFKLNADTAKVELGLVFLESDKMDLKDEPFRFNWQVWVEAAMDCLRKRYSKNNFDLSKAMLRVELPLKDSNGGYDKKDEREL